VAATIERVNGPVCRYSLKGEIAMGDLERFKASGITYGDTICLDSPGGNFVEGLNIAEHVVETQITTVLDKGASCFSACAMIFAAGSDGEEGLVFPKRKMHVSARLGFHAPYMEPPNKVYTPESVKTAYSFGLESVGRMISLGHDIGGKGLIPNNVILELLKKGPDQLYVVDTVLRAKELQIQLLGVKKQEWTPRQACNAAMNTSEGAFAVDACKDAGTAQPKPVSPGVVQYSFYGFGGEGSYNRVVRIKRDRNGRVLASISGFVVDEEIPSVKKFTPLIDEDALDPFLPFARQ
jgi:hypothetical protein